ncbi:hypothetical protein XhhCFBP4925_04105 [Xanthomonas hortorum pv. hederae]|nr:hypothetical protein XhhCFBP4925_04105 [Xanthomonas hortorum pv. hederae]PUF01841.1 hypothetical protein C7T87_00895 [Xanthomonas hortorum pv. hederae]
MATVVGMGTQRPHMVTGAIAGRCNEQQQPIAADASGAMMLSTTTSPKTTCRVRQASAAAKRVMAHRLLAARDGRKARARRTYG